MDNPMIMAIHWKAQKCDPYRRLPLLKWPTSFDQLVSNNWTETETERVCKLHVGLGSDGQRYDYGNPLDAQKCDPYRRFGLHAINANAIHANAI